MLSHKASRDLWLEKKIAQVVGELLLMIYELTLYEENAGLFACLFC